MIREATIEDTPEIERMCEAFKAASPYFFMDTDTEKLQTVVREMILSQNDVVLVATTDDGTLIGMVAGVITELPFSMCKIASEFVWWVDVEYRNTKAGYELHGAFEEWARSKKCLIASMSLLEDENLEKVDRAYRRSGYEPTERSYMKVLK